MNRRIGLPFVAVVIIALGWWAWRRHAIEDAWHEMESKASAVKLEIDTRFPVDSPRSEVVNFMKERFRADVHEDAEAHWLPVGRAPNRDWRMICGPWSVGVEVRFAADRLESTVATARGDDCL